MTETASPDHARWLSQVDSNNLLASTPNLCHFLSFPGLKQAPVISISSVTNPLEPIHPRKARELPRPNIRSPARYRAHTSTYTLQIPNFEGLTPHETQYSPQRTPRYKPLQIRLSQEVYLIKPTASARFLISVTVGYRRPLFQLSSTLDTELGATGYIVSMLLNYSRELALARRPGHPRRFQQFPFGSSPGLKAKGLTSLWPGRCTGGTDYSLIIQKLKILLF